VAFEVSGKLDSWSWTTLFFFLISVVGSYVGQIWSLGVGLVGGRSIHSRLRYFFIFLSRCCNWQRIFPAEPLAWT
jgi:hypothetical protein